METGAFSEASALSWNTTLSRTSVSSLSYARFSDRKASSTHGFEDLIRSLRNLSLRHYRLEELVREEVLGQGETYMVERCVDKTGKVFAVKHLKVSSQVNDHTFRQRLQSVIFEVQIMNHSPLKAHPNILTAFGYGWNSEGKLVIPYILVEYAPLGTMREHIKKQKPTLGSVEILLADVASGISVLHNCGIIHGDIKMENILLFPNFDRPAKAIAKIADFGHALILNDESCQAGNGFLKYRGTSLYNAPEVQNQDLFPIDQEDLKKCDIWAFGLMVWEACLAGKDYISHLKKNNLVMSDNEDQLCIDYTSLLECAKRSLPKPCIGSAMFLRIALHRTIQYRASERVISLQDIPLCTQWNARCLIDLQLNMALHLESPRPTYEMFRQDNGREISWEHQQQIFQGLKQTYSNRLVKESGPILWQIALCYLMGFGVDQDQKSAFEYTELAKSEDHPVAKFFSDLIDLNNGHHSPVAQGVYAKHISSLILANSALSDGLPPLVKSCSLGEFKALMDCLSDGAVLNLSTPDGCTLFHWLFIFQEQPLLDAIIKKVSGSHARRVVNLPCSLPRQPHKQWPLQLVGTPLATAISVNSLSTVRALLDLGADPFAPVYDSTQFPIDDNRSLWTAFHMAAKYHCGDILFFLIINTSSETQQSIPPLACALSFSTTVERLAMHGSDDSRIKQLDLTISTIQKIQKLSQVSSNGMTGLMQAVDFEDFDVVSALLRADPSLAQLPLRLPTNPEVFNMPIHFASQIAARRDTPETLLIPQLINSYADCFNDKTTSTFDNTQKIPLHLAVTGCSDRVTKWMLDKSANLLHVKDVFGRTPLHYCGSTANCELLLKRGANVNQTDHDGMSSLHRACYLGSVELAQCLLKWKPMLNLKNNKYGPPLHCGVIGGSLKVVLSLLEAGAMVDERDIQGNSAIHVAARLARYSILRVLMQYGASVTASNYNGKDAKTIADEAGNIGILNILNRGWETSVNQKILDVGPYSKRAKPLFKITSKMPNLGPDFLWEQHVLANTMPKDPGFEANYRRVTEADKAPENTRSMQEKEQEINELFETLLDTHLRLWILDNTSKTFLEQLITIYVHGLPWRPVHAAQLTTIWARTAHDLVRIMMGFAFCYSRGYCDRGCVFNETTQNGSFEPDLTHDSSMAQDPRRQGRESAIATESSNQRAIKELDYLSSQAFRPQISRLSGSSPEGMFAAPKLTETAISCVSYILSSTKPREFFPGREAVDFEHMMREICQMTCHNAPLHQDQTWSYFPELAEGPSSLTIGLNEGASSGSAGSHSAAAKERIWTLNDNAVQYLIETSKIHDVEHPDFDFDFNFRSQDPELERMLRKYARPRWFRRS